MPDSIQTVRTTRFGKRQVLYDAGLVAEPDESLFAPAVADRIAMQDSDLGRAKVIFHRSAELELVTKHYYRGGLVARLLGDIYFGVRAEYSRSFREWCMLSTMLKQGLPVPVPVAASVISSGVFYRADLVTLRIPHVRTVAELCQQQALSAETWGEIGATIRRFHNCNVYHADLNARNILIDNDGHIYLLDFDKSQFRLTGNSWRNANLARLRRSLDKFASSVEGFNFSDADWSALLQGYSAS
jgi:3-deoxy-D-manno-octulosonic acid kinase